MHSCLASGGSGVEGGGSSQQLVDERADSRQASGAAVGLHQKPARAEASFLRGVQIVITVPENTCWLGPAYVHMFCITPAP